MVIFYSLTLKDEICNKQNNGAYLLEPGKRFSYIARRKCIKVANLLILK